MEKKKHKYLKYLGNVLHRFEASLSSFSFNFRRLSLFVISLQKYFSQQCIVFKAYFGNNKNLLQQQHLMKHSLEFAVYLVKDKPLCKQRQGGYIWSLI